MPPQDHPPRISNTRDPQVAPRMWSDSPRMPRICHGGGHTPRGYRGGSRMLEGRRGGLQNRGIWRFATVGPLPWQRTVGQLMCPPFASCQRDAAPCNPSQSHQRATRTSCGITISPRTRIISPATRLRETKDGRRFGHMIRGVGLYPHRHHVGGLREGSLFHSHSYTDSHSSAPSPSHRSYRHILTNRHSRRPFHRLQIHVEIGYSER